MARERQSERQTAVLRTHLVIHMVSWQWLTSVWQSSSLCGLTVMTSRVLGRAQNSRLTGSTRLLVQLARLIRPRGFWEAEEQQNSNILNCSRCLSLPFLAVPGNYRNRPGDLVHHLH